MQRLEALYLDQVRPFLKQEFKYSNIYQVPKLSKIVINRGFDDSCQNTKISGVLLKEINAIACQSPILTLSSFSIASFRVKKGMPVGMKVTLRGSKMYAFLDRLINLTLPRIRDFQGLNKSFDRCGNFNLGLREQLIFPELELDKVVKVKGINISIVTTSNSDIQSFVLLRELGMPFKN